MSFFQWRRFNFFDICKDVDGASISGQLGEDNVITCATSGRGNLVLGDLKGNIYRVVNRHWEVAIFHAWDGKVEELIHPRQSPFLLGLGLEGGVRCLKVWNLERFDTATGGPEVVRVSRLARPGSSAEPFCLAISENLQLLAVGYDDGGLVLHRGDCTRDRGHKTKILLEQGHTLAGLAFKVADNGVYLYVATEADILMFNVTRDRETKTVLDSLGCPSKGLVVAPPNQANTHFVTGQSDAIYCYNPEGRGQCYAFEGKKRLLNWFRGYLTVISEEGLDKATVTVFDVQNKFIGFSAPIKPVLAVLAEWGSILLINQEGKVHQLVERDTQTKLGMLFKKNFYDVAIKIAKNQHLDSEGLVDIFRQYGDHLYSKGDQAGAIEQYIKTIGTLEPSYVIQKFLDAQKIHNLTAYLQALHRKGLASEDHTTLLLNCYTKLKDSEKLDEFIMTKDREVDFDVDIAINVCRQAGYCKHALALASKHGKHDLYLAIVVENQGDHQSALRYITGLPRPEAFLHIKKYGPVLIKEVPAETTEFLMNLCVEGLKEENAAVGHPDNFIPLFLNDQEGMVKFLSHLVSHLPPRSLSKTAYSTLLEYSLYTWSAGGSTEEQTARQTAIMDLLRGETDQYSKDHALVLCQQAGFTPGLLYLYQQAGLHDQILGHHFSAGNWEAGITACRRFGPGNPQLWVTALQLVAASEAEVPPAHFREVLDNIERYRLLSPLQVVSTLSSCPTATLGVVRDYLLRILDIEERSIQEDKRVIEQYTRDSQTVREKINKLTDTVTIFQSTKCSACNHNLELPTVHFLCGHGYHQHCFQSYSDSDQECPACHQENKKILDIIKSQEAGRNHHDQFHAQLEKAEDGFSIVAEYFGRGLFSQPVSLSTLPASVMSPKSGGLVEEMQGLDIQQTEGRLRLQDRDSGKQVTRELISEGRMRAEGRGGGVITAPSEARMRAEGRGGGVITAPSEARMRAEGRGGGVITAQSEARMRAEGRGGGVITAQSEARMRAEGRGGGVITAPSEARMRADGRAEGPAVSLSEGRMRMETGSAAGLVDQKATEGRMRQNPGQNGKTGGSLAANLTYAKSPSPTLLPPVQQYLVPRREDIAPQNPFGTPDSDSLGEDNPFASSPRRTNRSPSPLAKQAVDSSNPFGDDGDEYDEEKNPFAD